MRTLSAHVATGARWQLLYSGRMLQSVEIVLGWRWICAIVATISWPNFFRRLKLILICLVYCKMRDFISYVPAAPQASTPGTFVITLTATRGNKETAENLFNIFDIRIPVRESIVSRSC